VEGEKAHLEDEKESLREKRWRLDFIIIFLFTDA